MSSKLAWSGVAVITLVVMSAAQLAQPVLAKNKKAPPAPEHHVRVGVIAPHASRSVAQHVRDLEVQQLSSIGVEPVVLSSATAKDAVSEARALDCDYVLESTLDRKLETLHYRVTETQSGVRVLEADEHIREDSPKQPEAAEVLVTQATQAIRSAVK
ncbi:MAG TPA: hypothetical protein VGC88_12725 [Terriglobales bacterium]